MCFLYARVISMIAHWCRRYKSISKVHRHVFPRGFDIIRLTIPLRARLNAMWNHAGEHG